MPHWIEAYDGERRRLVDLDHFAAIDVVATQKEGSSTTRYMLRALGYDGRSCGVCLLDCETFDEAVEAYEYLRDTILDRDCQKYFGSLADFSTGWKWRNKEQE